MTASKGRNRRNSWALGVSAAALVSGGLASAPTAHALVTPDSTTPAAVVDTANTRPYWVGIMIRNEAGNSGGTCTGLLINPRTVLFAAHCVDGLTPGAYDGDTAGNRARVAYTTNPTFGRTNLRYWLFGQDFVVPDGGARADGQSVMVWYDPRSRNGSAALSNSGTFLPADVALAGFDTASELLGRDAQSGIGLLFTPLSSLVPVTIGGYGTSGNGQTGVRTGAVEASYHRRLGQNLLGFLGDERSIALGVYPAATANLLEPAGLVYQDLYWVDFDDPNRATRPFFNGPGSDPLCVSTNANCRLDHDVFPGAAVSGEAITGAGDSGSPLVTNAFGREVSLGVLSQGSRFFYESLGNPNDNLVRFTEFSNYGTTGGWNPLFLFWDQIVVNNPYKYVTTTAGDGEWTDPTRWVQEVDPLYYTLAGSSLVNALPTTAALGVSGATPNVGAVRPSPSPAATCAFTGTCPTTGGTGQEADASSPPRSLGTPSLVDSDSAGRIDLSDQMPTAVGSGPESVFGLEFGSLGTLEFLGRGAAEVSTGATSVEALPGVSAEAMSTASWSSGTLLQVNSGSLTGPGTTNFVPNNTLGTPGIQNSTRWFEVNLRSAGTTFLTNSTVTIDRLSVRGASSGLTIRSGARLNTTISSFLDAGSLRVNGVFSPLRLTVAGGSLTGTGSIVTTATSGAGLLVNGGLLSPGDGPGGVGTLSVTGNTAFTLAGVLGIDISSLSAADRLNVTGQMQLGGGLAANFLGSYIPTFGSKWTVASASAGVTGSFSTLATNLQGVLRPKAVVSGNDLQIEMIALPFSNVASYGDADQRTIARTLDAIRSAPGGYGALSGVFDGLDPIAVANLPLVMSTLSSVPAQAQISALGMHMNGAIASQQLSARMGKLRNSSGGGVSVSGAQALGVQLASADPNQAFMAGVSALAAADKAASALEGLELKPGYSMFVDVRSLVDTDAIVTASGTRADLDGVVFTAGLDRTFSNGAFIGGAMTYSNGDAGTPAPAQGAEGGGLQVSGYAGQRFGQAFVEAYAGIGALTFDTLRRLVLANGAQSLAGEVEGDLLTAGGRIGFDMPAGGQGTITPYLALDAAKLEIDRYTEQGGSAAQTVGERVLERMDLSVGATYSASFKIGDGLLKPSATVAMTWNGESAGASVMRSSFGLFPTAAMVFEGPRREESSLNYSAGFSYETKDLDLGLAYHAGDDGLVTGGSLTGSLSWRF